MCERERVREGIRKEEGMVVEEREKMCITL